MPAAIVWYALAVLVVVAGPAAVVLLLGTPEPALPSEWADARARIADGTYPAGYVVDIVSGLGLLAWLGGLWLVVMGMRRQRRKRHRDTTEETDIPPAGLSRANGDNEPDEPWYRQGPPIFDEPFSDEYPRVVVPPDETAPGDEPQDSPWQPAPAAAGVEEPFGMLPPDPMAEDMVADAEVIGGARLTGGEPVTGTAATMSGTSDPDPDEPPMIVPVRAYYFTRAGDTLRSISAQFLNTPMRWEELRSLNAASPGVSTLGPDSLLPVGTALALPGDPLPWGKPDPVYLWTLAEKFLFTAWGREPTPEEVVPFWRGLTGGAQLESGAPPIQVEHLAAPAFTEPPPPAPETADEPAAESAPTEVAHEPQPAPAEPPPAEVAHEPQPAPEAAADAAPIESPAPEVPTEPAAADPPPPEVAHEPEPAPAEPPVPDGFVPAPPPVPGVEPAAPPTDFQPPPPVTPPPFDSPVPPSHEPAHAPAAYQPPPAYDSPVPPTHEPAAYQPPPAYEPPVPPTHEPVPPAYEPPVPPTHEPAHTPTAYQPPPAYEPPVPPTHEPAHTPTAYQPPPAYEPPVPPTHEPAHTPTAYQPPPAYDSPVPPSHEPIPPMAPEPALPDLGPVEPEVPYVEAEPPRMPSFMPSLTGAETAAPAPEADVVSSNRGLAGTAIGDAMMLWQLSRIRRRRGGRSDGLDPMEESLRQSARTDTLNLIEAAMRHLRAVTVGQLREKPAVLAVRVGTYGFEVLLNRPTQAPDGWQAASGGYVLELPQGVTAEDLEATAQGPTLCPALVPVGDTLEGPLMLNIEEIGCLIVSGPGGPSVNLLNAVVGTLGSSPLAGDIRIITVGLDTPAGLPGWERVHTTSFDSPQLEELLATAHTGSGTFLDVLVVGPGNDLLIQRGGQVATTPGSRLALVGATSSVAARWPWRIHVDETTTAVVHPIACTMAAAQAMAPAMSQLLSEAPDPSLLAPPRF